MSQPAMTVALVALDRADWEAHAVRLVLEGFNVRVVTYWIGRPNDLIGVLDGRDLYPDISHIYLACHGDEGRICLPTLHESVYTPEEPREYFGPTEVRRHAQLRGKTVLATGCTTGSPALAKAFLDAGCETYIGPVGDIQGTSALFFAIRFYYEHIRNSRTLQQAFELAAGTDEETELMKWNSNSSAQ